ncbi:MAG TPA: TonB-dependent receptor [Vicinamibacterales bacterium]|nr:TonB-dependent receptor [Vicinamibacterales bacterium]
MTAFRQVATGLAVVIGLGGSVMAQSPSGAPAATAKKDQAQASGQKPAPTPTPTPQAKPETFKENVVVSASKIEQQIVDAPATMSVIGPKDLAVAPSSNYADLLKGVPGVNITQISARDVNVNSRSATSSLATAQLSVVDGRSIYQDFFGFTMWEFMPSNLDEIKRIEVIRGPASAVWGANALNGVINVITKSPREMLGTSVSFGAGAMDREVNKNKAESATIWFARATHAQAINDRWSYKLSVGTYVSDPFARPTGTIPNGGTTQYPSYKNDGTNQPKIDARFDYDFADPSKKIQIAAGVSGTDGMMHTGIGPFDIARGAKMGYWRATYTKSALKLQAFMNILDGSATNVVAVDPAGKPIGLDFNTKTFDFELGDSRIVGGKHVVTYGGNLRANRFTLTIAPGENSRTEGGAYVQDEFLASDKVRLVAGARVDKFTSIDSAVFSPRVAVVMKPAADQSVRVSYNRAFRAPSMINNNLDTTVSLAVIPLGAINAAFGSAQYLVPTRAVGNSDLTEEYVDAFEVAYTANLRGRLNFSAAWFYTKYQDGIYFTQTAEWLTAPPGFPGLGPFTANQVWGGFLASTGLHFPSQFTYRNLGEVKNQGIELGVDGALTDTVRGFVNYSFQADPKPVFPGLTPAQALGEINIPSKHQFGLGLSTQTKCAFGSLSVTRSSRAFWQDVLDSRYAGYTNANTSVNLTAGAKFQDDKYSVALKVTNLMNQTIQQHIFGDIIKRMAMVEFKVNLK